MDTIEIRTGFGQSHSGNDAEHAQRVYGRNWPFPDVNGPKPLTAKQIKAAKAKELSEYEDALL